MGRERGRGRGVVQPRAGGADIVRACRTCESLFYCGRLCVRDRCVLCSIRFFVTLVLHCIILQSRARCNAELNSTVSNCTVLLSTCVPVLYSLSPLLCTAVSVLRWSLAVLLFAVLSRTRKHPTGSSWPLEATTLRCASGMSHSAAALVLPLAVAQTQIQAEAEALCPCTSALL